MANKSPKNMSIEELTAHIIYCKDLKAQRVAELPLEGITFEDDAVILDR